MKQSHGVENFSQCGAIFDDAGRVDSDLLSFSTSELLLLLSKVTNLVNSSSASFCPDWLTPEVRMGTRGSSMGTKLQR